MQCLLSTPYLSGTAKYYPRNTGVRHGNAVLIGVGFSIGNYLGGKLADLQLTAR